MHYFVPRLLTILSVVAVLTFVPAAFAGGLLGGLLDTVEDVVEGTVDLIDGDQPEQEEDEPATQETEDNQSVEEPAPQETGEDTSVEEPTEPPSGNESDQPEEEQTAPDDEEAAMGESTQEGSDDSQQAEDETEPIDENTDDDSTKTDTRSTGPAGPDESEPAEQDRSSSNDRRSSGQDEEDDDDIYVRVETGLLGSTVESLGLGGLGDTLYTLQEDVVHGTVTKLTGVKVPHFYTWVCIDDVCLPVDPFLASN